MKFRYVIFMLLVVPVIINSLKIASQNSPDEQVINIYQKKYLPAKDIIDNSIQEFLNGYSQALSAFAQMQRIQPQNSNVQNATSVLMQKLKTADNIMNKIYNDPNFLELFKNALGGFEKALQSTPQGAQNLLEQLNHIYTHYLNADAQQKINAYLKNSNFYTWYNQQKQNIDAAIQAQQARA